MKKYIINAGWMLIEKSIRILLNFTFIGLIAKQLGPEEFGVLSFSQSVVLMLLAVTSLGLDNILIHEFTIKDHLKNEVFSTALWARFLLGLIFTFCIFAYFIIDDSFILNHKLIFLVSLAALAFYSQNTYFSYFQAKSESKIVTKISLLGFVISSAIKIYFLLMQASAIMFALAFSFDVILSFFLLWIGSMKYSSLSVNISFFRKNILIDLLSQSWPMVASSVLVVLYTRLDQIMIANMLGAEEVGLFSVAIRISDAYVFIPTLLATSFYPMLSNVGGNKNIQFYFDIVFGAAFFCGLTVILLSPVVIPVLFGREYIESISVINVTIFSSMFAVLGGASTNYLIMLRLGHIRLIRAMVGLGVNFILNIIWIPKYGILGAAYASLIAQIFAAWLSNAISHKTRDCFIWQTKSVLTIGLPGMLNLYRKKRFG